MKNGPESTAPSAEASIELPTTIHPGHHPVARGSWIWFATAGGAALALGVGLLAALWFLQRPLALFFIGLTLAAAMAPVVQWISTWLPRTLAVVVSFLLLALLGFALGALVFPPLVEQASNMVERLPELADQSQQWLQQRLPISDAQILDQITSQMAGLGSLLVSLPMAVSSSVFDVSLVVSIAIYALIAAPHTHATLLSLVPEERQRRVTHILSRLAHTMGGYVRAVAITGMVIGTLGYVGLLLIGVNFPLPLAIVAGVAEFLPFIGPFIAGALMVIVAFLQSPIKALITLVFVLGLQQLEGNLIAPNVMHPQTCISPLLAILALFAGASLGGVLGGLIAIPLTAALRVLVVEVVFPAVRRQTGAGVDESDIAC